MFKFQPRVIRDSTHKTPACFPSNKAIWWHQTYKNTLFSSHDCYLQALLASRSLECQLTKQFVFLTTWPIIIIYNLPTANRLVLDNTSSPTSPRRTMAIETINTKTHGLRGNRLFTQNKSPWLHSLFPRSLLSTSNWPVTFISSPCIPGKPQRGCWH